MVLVVAWFFGLAWWRKRIDPGRLLLLAVMAAAPLAFLAIEAGWFVTEFGRQPWIIYQVMRTADGATLREGIAWILMLFALIYVALAAGLALLLFREQRQPLRPLAPLRRVPNVP
jgi:cytochrome d ubiquinol oxidase subunit I